MSKSSGRLVERWHTTIPGVWANVFLVDPDTESLFVSDGWSVPYAALSLHRMDLESGTHIADVQTRRQWVMGVTLAHGHLFAATASRLFELRRTDLGVLKQWDKGLVRYTTQLVEHGRQLVTANHLAPTIGVFDPSTDAPRASELGASQSCSVTGMRPASSRVSTARCQPWMPSAAS
jgi:hypothetical protein